MFSVDFMDQVGARPETFQANISFSETDIVSVKELIAARVTSEYEKLRKWGELDPVRFAIYGDLPPVARIDIETVINGAVTAFDKRQYLLFVDNKQCSHLEEVIHLGHNSKVKFLRITPLKGG